MDRAGVTGRRRSVIQGTGLIGAALVVGGLGIYAISRWWGTPALADLRVDRVTFTSSRPIIDRHLNHGLILVTSGAEYALWVRPTLRDSVAARLRPGDSLTTWSAAAGGGYRTPWQVVRGADTIVAYADRAAVDRERDRRGRLLGRWAMVIGLTLLVAALAASRTPG